MLKLDDTSEGVRWTATLDLRSQAHNDLLVSVERQDLHQCSAGFSVRSDIWNSDFSHRDITGLSRLVDCSIVTYPASPTTSVDVQRSVARDQKFIHQCTSEVRAGRTLSK